MTMPEKNTAEQDFENRLRHLEERINLDQSEQDIHKALEVDPILKGVTYAVGFSVFDSVFHSKPSLHKVFPDFAIGELEKSTLTYKWTLIEIERPSTRLFTKSGDPASELTHAVNQIASWRHWINSNMAYAREILPDIDSFFFGIVVAGRRAHVDKPNALKTFNSGLMGCSVKTYDWLLDKIKEYKGIKNA